jgi:rod shape-determining protein MreD
MSNGRVGILRIIITSAIALLLTIVPLPQLLNFGRPDWLLLIVIYWSLNAPQIAGLTYAWICGLIIDALIGTLIGQHALAYAITAAIAQHFALRIRVFPVLHQAIVVLLIVSIYHFLLFWIDGIVGTAIASWIRWLPALVGALLWPILVAVIDTSNRRMR